MKDNICIFDIIKTNSNYSVAYTLENGVPFVETVVTTAASYSIEASANTSGKQIDAVAKQCKASAKDIRENYSRYRNSLVTLANALVEYRNATVIDYNNVVANNNAGKSESVKQVENNLLDAFKNTFFLVGVVGKERAAMLFNSEADKTARWNNSTACAKLASIFSMFVEYKTDANKKRVAVSSVGTNAKGVENITASVVNAFENALFGLYTDNYTKVVDRTTFKAINTIEKEKIAKLKAEKETEAKQKALALEMERKAKENNSTASTEAKPESKPEKKATKKVGGITKA